MKSPPPTPAAQQADALVRQIARQVAERRRELLDAADREADEIRQRARDKARRQARRAIDEMRATERQRTQQLDAELETAARQQASVQARETLAAAWPRLAEAIERRWRDPATRNRWIDAQLAVARSRLPAQGWAVRHPAGLASADTAALLAVLAAVGAGDATLQPDPDLCCGLVVEAGGVRLDGTPAALLADRARVEAALLAELDAVVRGRAPR